MPRDPVFECSCCSKVIKTTYEANLHPLLDCLLCRKCYQNYGSGDFSNFEDGVDEAGDDNYCRWCCDGGNLFGCMNVKNGERCHYAFCEDCIKKNCPNDIVLQIAKMSEEEQKRVRWMCYACDKTKVADLRKEAKEAMEFLNKNGSKNKAEPAPSPAKKKKTGEMQPQELPKPQQQAPQKAQPPQKPQPQQTAKSQPQPPSEPQQQPKLQQQPKPQPPPPKPQQQQPKPQPQEQQKQNQQQQQQQQPKPQQQPPKPQPQQVPQTRQTRQQPPASVPQPQPASAAHLASKPQPALKPQLISKPQPASTPQPVSKPQPASTPQLISQPQPASTPQPASKQQPASTPQLISQPQPASTPQPASKPQPASTPAPAPAQPLQPQTKSTSSTTAAKSRADMLNKPMPLSKKRALLGNSVILTDLPINEKPQKTKDAQNGKSSTIEIVETNRKDNSKSMQPHSRKEAGELPVKKLPGKEVVLSKSELKRRLEVHLRTKDDCVEEIGISIKTVIEMMLSKDAGDKSRKKMINLKIESLQNPIQEFVTILDDLKMLNQSL